MKFAKILATSLLFVSVFTYGQKLQFGPEFGINLPVLESNELGRSFVPCLHGGANVSYHFTDYFYLRSGVFATQKRQSYASSDSMLVNLFGLEDLIGIDGINLNSYTEIAGRVSQFYIEVPIVAAYQYKNISISAGPYFAYMFAARTKELKSIDTPFLRTVDVATLVPEDVDADLLLATLPPPEETKYTASSSKSGLLPFDFGVKAGISYQFNKLGANINYQYGFFDYQSASKSELENHNYFQMTLHYNFGLGK